MRLERSKNVKRTKSETYMQSQNIDFHKKIIEQNALLIRLLALNVTKDCKNLTERVLLLSEYGFKAGEIAFMLGKQLHSVTGITTKARQKAKTKA